MLPCVPVISYAGAFDHGIWVQPGTILLLTRQALMENAGMPRSYTAETPNERRHHIEPNLTNRTAEMDNISLKTNISAGIF